MPSIVLTSPVAGNQITAGLHATNYSALQTLLNAGLDAGNWAAGAIFAPSKLTQEAATTGQALVWSGTIWAPATVGTQYRKTTSKTVNTTVAATDLLNAEITVAAGVMGTNKMARLTAWGDWMNNSGATVASPRLQVVFGGTTLLDTGISGTNTTGATRNSWRAVVEILNLGAANSQMSHMDLQMMVNGTLTQVQNVFTTGQGILASLTATGQVVFGEGVNPATALDTATSKTLVLNVINGSASATYETKLLGALVEIV